MEQATEVQTNIEFKGDSLNIEIKGVKKWIVAGVVTLLGSTWFMLNNNRKDIEVLHTEVKQLAQDVKEIKDCYRVQQIAQK